MQGLYRENPSIVLRDIKGDLKKNSSYLEVFNVIKLLIFLKIIFLFSSVFIKIFSLIGQINSTYHRKLVL